jgi:thiamine biosynthesis lipoprotein
MTTMMDTLLSPRRRTVLQAMAAASLLAACGDRRVGASAAPALSHRGPAMGSQYTLKIAGPALSAAGQDAARAAVAAAIERVEVAMSTYRPESELSRFNAHGAGTPFAVSAETLAVFAAAQEVAAASGGAFDVTVLPAVDVWGFGPSIARGSRAVPSTVALAGARASIGWQALTVDTAAGTLAKQRADLQADLSGIAKGHGADAAARALDALGHRDYMIEVGGEVVVRGRNPEGSMWRIGIEAPDAVPQRAYTIVPLRDRAMATSGDYRIFFEQDGRRYTHEIDPATGAPVSHRLASVSVVAADCMHADAWSTALFVAGPVRGPALANELGLAAHFLSRMGDGRFEETVTPAFAALGASRAA